MADRPRWIRLRRWATAKARCHGLPFLAAMVDPGTRIRLWDSEFALLADSDRGDVIPARQYGQHVTFEPAQSVRIPDHA